jgi:hypothetical protein
VSDSELAFEQLRLADGRWESALRASSLAPPDPGFAGRIRAIASAAEQEAAAFRTADAAGLAWPPLPAAREMNLSYELRRGGTRPGPVEPWERFDAAVGELGVALEGVALSAIARAFTNLADIAHTLADEIQPIDTQTSPHG